MKKRKSKSAADLRVVPFFHCVSDAALATGLPIWFIRKLIWGWEGPEEKKFFRKNGPKNLIIDREKLIAAVMAAQ